MDRNRAPFSEAPPPEWAGHYAAGDFPPWALTADVIALRVDPAAEDLQALIVERGAEPFEGEVAWPGGFVRWTEDRNAAAAGERELREETGYWPAHELIELRTYDESGRDPRQHAGRIEPDTGRWRNTGVRIVSKTFLALYGREPEPGRPAPGGDARHARWTSVYSYLPWEDTCSPAALTMTGRIVSRLYACAGSGALGSPDPARAEIERLFSRSGWNEEEARARWDLLFAARLVHEAWRDRWGRPLAGTPNPLFGQPMAFDHRVMLADAIASLRLRIKREPAIAHSLCPPEFRLSDLQAVFEAAAGRRLYRSNFRRALYQQTALVAPSGRRLYEARPGKPAELFHFAPDALRTSLTPGLNLPWQPIGDPVADE